MLLTGLSIASLLVIPASISHAETVSQAMRYAYNHSPQIKLERAKLKLSGEGIIAAQAGLMPTLNGEISSSYTKNRTALSADGTRPASTTYSSQFGAQIGLSAGYNLWDNGITENRIAQAQLGQMAQRDAFANAEQGFLMNVFTAYVDVLRDSALLNVQIKEFNVIAEQQRAAEARFEEGQATSTDIALAKARKAGASSAIAGAKAQRDASRAIYEQYVGHRPKNLRQPKQVSRLLPKSEQAAVRFAEAHHPILKSLKKAVLVAQKAVDISEAGLLPSANAFGSATHQFSYDGSASSSALTVGAKLSIPIYNGGALDSQVRQSKIKVAQARLDLSVARAQIKAGVKARWASLRASRTGVGANVAQVRASRAVLNGVRAEAEEGVRTSFDVLDSEKQLFSAKVQSIVSQRGLLVAEMQLLSSIGGLTASKLGIR